MNKSWLDAGHSSFVAILEWVAMKLGKRVIKIDPWEASTARAVFKRLLKLCQIDGISMAAVYLSIATTTQLD